MTNKFAAWLAYSPLIIAALDIALAMSGRDVNRPPTNSSVTLIAAILTIWLAYLDAGAVNKAGANPGRKRLLPFILLSPLGYLWRRAAVTRTSYRYLWIWLACVVACVIVEAALIIEP